jgi:hypothetical protein
MEAKEPGNYEPLYRYNSLYADNNDVKAFYDSCYRSIQKVNAGLYYNELPEMDEDERAQLKAELRFLRAFYHFILIEQFGGIVINNEFTEDPRVEITKSTLEGSYEFVVSEMEAVLPSVPAISNPGRVNKDVVNHYLAKVYLTRAWDLGASSDFTKAKEYADAVIATRGEISIPYSTVWDPFNEDNDEFIFSVQYSLESIANAREDGNQQSSLFGVYGGGGGGGIKRYRDAFAPSYFVHSNFQDNDNRYQFNFMWVQYRTYFTYYEDEQDEVFCYYPVIRDPNFGEPTAADTAQWLDEADDYGVLNDGFIVFPQWVANEDKFNQNTWGATDRRVPSFKKFDCPENGFECTNDYTASVRNIILARLAETYFLKAEACIGLNEIAEARTLVQHVIDRPGNKVDASGDDITNAMDGVTGQQEALEAYLLETGKEQLGEYNGRWALLRRTKMLEYMVTKYNPDLERYNLTIQSKHNYRPIPEEAIILNDGLSEDDQNPGY